MKKGNLIGLILILIFVVLQIIPNEKPEVIEHNKDDLILNNSIPDSVQSLLKNACYDCHSNETVYPWYAHIAPVSWLVIRDTKIGRGNLNFSEWESLSKMDKAKHLEEIFEAIEEGLMPMPIYILMHPEAELSMSDREKIMEWSDEFAESLFE